MSIFDKVREENRDLASVLKTKKGIRKIVEELYPDSAHFIHELLQNAEDTNATVARFILTDRALSFEHNGRPFEEDDVRGICDIGEGTKATDADKIGCFGVGFKAVFAYTETPRVSSPTLSFEISELVLPNEIPASDNLGKKTRFEFPFNNSKKQPEVAFEEIKEGLEDLAQTTLLFLASLKSIHWQIENAHGKISRTPHSENHIEIIKHTDGHAPRTSHFLRFTHPVPGMEKQFVAIAFDLGFVQNVISFKTELPFAKQFRIIPAVPGRVAVSFPAEKEASGLRFHLHAPFVPELSRASLKSTPANHPLFQQLAALAARSLHKIRDFGLLNAEFLSVLPNNHADERIPSSYQAIRDAIIQEMNDAPLTPTQAKSHAPAKYLLQARSSLKELLSPEDLKSLVPYEVEAPQWAINAAQKNSTVDRFLSALAIRKWDIDEFVARLNELPKASLSPSQLLAEIASRTPNKSLRLWLKEKSAEWLQQMYAVMFRELTIHGCWKLKTTRIVQISDGRYLTGEGSFFPSETVKHDEKFPRVTESILLSGKNKPLQEDVRKFLSAIGVIEVSELVQVQAILDQRYADDDSPPPDNNIHFQDLQRFIALVEKEPKSAGIFAPYVMFARDRKIWGKPDSVFLDAPFLSTGLTAYYDAIGPNAKRAPLSPRYRNEGISLERLQLFAKAIGVKWRLEVECVSCFHNPDYIELLGVGGQKNSSPIDRDYQIPEIEKLLKMPTTELSLLLWKTMCSLPLSPNCLEARYQKTQKNGYRCRDSQLVHTLRESAWVPQTGGTFVKPRDAHRNQLPAGFSFDSAHEWLKKVRFGEATRQRTEENLKRDAFAKELGFLDPETLADGQRFASIPKEERKRMLDDHERKKNAPFPEHESRNPDRRAERVGEQADNAPERTTEQRNRSVAIGRELVKEQAAQYLRGFYTDANGDMICQACKAAMPFKLDDGSLYFEKVEFLPRLKKRHYQNYLALCPNHAAMFQYANGSAELMRSMFAELETTVLEVVLAQQNTTLQFTKTHIADLKKVIEVDEATSDFEEL